eukprot:4517546-Prymnesium_polylepis.1
MSALYTMCANYSRNEPAGECHPTVARIHPYPLGRSSVAYFLLVPRICRAVRFLLMCRRSRSRRSSG